MKVALLVDELPTSSAPKIVGEEAYYLEKLGVKCDVYVLKYKVSEIPPAHAEYIRLAYVDKDLGFLGKICGWRIPSFSFFSLYHFAYPYLLSRRASKILDQYDAIVIHFTSTAIFASKLSLRNAKMVFYYWDPISYIFENVYKESWSRIRQKLLSLIASRFDRKLLLRFDAVVLPSKFHLRRIMRLGANKPIKIVYPGAEIAESIPKERGDYLLAVARWEKGKNPFFFIKVAKELKTNYDAHFEIIMVGPWDPYTLEEFQRSAIKADVLSAFKIVGPRYGSELRQLYLKARCLIHAKTEAFGFTGLEAVAHGCPIIFPKGSGVTELFIHGKHGYFPDEGAVEEYAEYVTKMLSDERLAWKMGYEAWNMAKNYTWENHAKELLKAIS
ncbi:MAG: glycosyltransferase family 4 protein [Nitrososphaeria archaeon]